MATILHIDTAFNEALVMISNNGEEKAYIENNVINAHASFLHPAIQKLLASADITLSDVDTVAVANGPGSYTGLRVGLAAAKGICYALKKPIICVNNLQLMATAAMMQEQDQHLLYAPMIDARRMEVFTGIYNYQGEVIFYPQAHILTPNSFSEQLQTSKILFFGNAIEKWKNVSTHPNALYSTGYDLKPAFAKLSFDLFMTNNFSDLAYTEPFYLKDFHFGN